MIFLNFTFSGRLVHRRVFLGQGHGKGRKCIEDEGAKVMIKSSLEMEDEDGEDGGLCTVIWPIPWPVATPVATPVAFANEVASDFQCHRELRRQRLAQQGYNICT